MNDWSRMRKRLVLVILIVAIVVLIGVPLYFLFYKAPTCSDGLMNGDETGVDCGGSCQRLCTAESLPIVINGDPRVLTVAPNVFEVVALLENPNINAEIYRAQYVLKVYDASSTIPVKTIEGSTFVPRGASFALFEGPFSLEAGIQPVRSVLEWHKDSLLWKKTGTVEPDIEVTSISLTKEEISPRLDAIVENQSLESVSHIDLVALVSDEEGNLFSASKTYIESLSSGESMPVVFTWPRGFSKKAVDISIITRIFPDSSFIR